MVIKMADIDWTDTIPQDGSDRALIEASGRFDPKFYLETYPDVAVAGVDPLLHYLKFGATEDRDPSPIFSTRGYNEAHLDAAARQKNPLLDAIQTGFFDRLAPNVQQATIKDAHPVNEIDIENAHRILLGRPAVSVDLIDATLGGTGADLVAALLRSDAFRTDIAEPLQNRRPPAVAISHASIPTALKTWVKRFFGVERDTSQHLAQRLKWPGLLSILFHDPAFRQTVQQWTPQWAKDNFLASLAHFAATYLWPDSLQRDYDILSKSQAFGTEYYLARYPDIAAANLDPIYHYLIHGAAEARDPSAEFSTLSYIRENHDVATSGLNPLVHFVSEGRHQGRRTRRADYVPPPPAIPSATQGMEPIDAWRANFAARLEQRLGDLAHADLTPPFPAAPPAAPAAPAKRERRAASAAAIQPAPATSSRPTFSIIMTVYDTDPVFLRDLADSVRAQAFTDFEWLILDNGSSNQDTIALCQDIAASDPRVRLFRVDRNLHIIGGNRYVFNRAEGHYIVPIDSDDLLYPDSLALFADVLRQSRLDPPVLLYSDEQKVDVLGRPLELIWRWNFAFAHAMATAPAAHLMAFSRDVARAAGVYSDDYARGSHDWDTMVRITERGGGVRHVPEVLYGWRVHEQSTASASTAKDYIIDSQAAVMAQSLSRRGLEPFFAVKELSPGVLGWYHACREKTAIPPVMADIVIEAPFFSFDNLLHNLGLVSPTCSTCRVLYPLSLAGIVETARAAHSAWPVQHWVSYATADELSVQLNTLHPGVFAKAIISNDVCLQSPDAILDAIGTLELDPRAGIVGGPIMQHDIVSSLGLLCGLNDFLASPFSGWNRNNIPFGLWATPHSVDAFPIKAVVIRASVIEAGIHIGGIDNENSMAGVQFCLEATRQGYGVVYTALLQSEIRYDLPVSHGTDTTLKAGLILDFAQEIAAGSLSSHLSQRAECFGQLKSRMELGWTPPYETARLAPAMPLNLQIERSLDAFPTINLLLPGVRMISMSGGPNTALNIGYRLAELGFAVRILSTDVPSDVNLTPMWKHIISNGGGKRKPSHLEIVDASDRSKPVFIGANDLLFATAWWTAQMANWARPLLGDRPFIYLIQDFEPILYAASSAYVLAQETYGFDTLPLINTSLLYDYLVENKIGRFIEADYLARCLVFEPAIQPDNFYYKSRTVGRRTLLFYARPTNGIRNLFENGVAAIQFAIHKGLIDPEEWSFIGMGEAFHPINLGRGATLECAPWLGFDDYATQMRRADILLSLMLSPHPSYPPLEMAACGGIVVTNAYANKTAERMAQISANIITAEPTITALADAIRQAVGRLPDTTSRQAGAQLGLPSTWDESFERLMPALTQALHDLGLRADAALRPPIGEPRTLAAPKANPGPYRTFLAAAAARRCTFNTTPQEPGLLSFITTVWNTAPAFLKVLADSVHNQTGGTVFEWYVLDNGTSRPDTKAFLAELAQRPYVRLQRVEDNLGIIGGMRHCLGRATGRYILPLDSDDYLFPDCIQTLTWYIQKHDYPALLYTDEDKLVGEELFLPYLKPDFDPVLFTNSCYIAHLGAIDRRLGLELDLYSDPETEGSHDWDSFTRFLNAGHTPVHVPEVLYSWRMHPQSTASNINSKPVVFGSQVAVLRRFLAAQPGAAQFELRPSPLFQQTPDWWFRRRRIKPRPLTTLLIHSNAAANKPRPAFTVSPNVDHEVIQIALDASPASLLPHIARCAAAGRLVHILSNEIDPVDDEWYWEALGIMDLFPGTICVGGRISSYDVVLEAGRFLGFGDGCGCTDRGRPLTDVGYSAQMWKQHSVGAVSAMHAVFDAAFLAEAIHEIRDEQPSIANLGSWVGGVARRKGRRVVYSPMIDARTTIDWDALVPAAERARLVLHFADILPDVQLRSPHFGLTPALAYEPCDAAQFNPGEQGIVMPTYADWQSMYLATRLARARTHAIEVDPSIDFSILTTLYAGTDAKLFLLTAATVLEQTCDNFEWVLLAHGPISPGVDGVLRRLATDPRIRVHRLATNLGIVGGMRHVLEAARAEYIVPLDSDDLLTLDALQLLAAEISAAAERPAYIYSDEDILAGSGPRSPYLRPDWDPVLDLENSWIWHVGAFRRDLALKLGVYQHKGSEYCHDWDTVYRFTVAGHRPLHMREIAYHWRHHEGSTSNSENPDQGSAGSVKSLLQQKITDRGLNAICQVAPYPLWRGALEWWIERRPTQLPPLATLLFGERSPALPLPIKGLRVQTVPIDQFLRALRDTVGSLPDDAIVLLASADAALPDIGSFLEAIKLLEFVDDLVAVTGRLLQGGTVVSSGLVTDEHGRLSAPYDNRSIDDPGPYALAWKPQCVAVPASVLVFVRADFMKSALASCPGHCSANELPLWLGALAMAEGKRIGFSPLVVGMAPEAWRSGFDPVTTQTTWNGFLESLKATANLRLGAAAYNGLRPT